MSRGQYSQHSDRGWEQDGHGLDVVLVDIILSLIRAEFVSLVCLERGVSVSRKFKITTTRSHKNYIRHKQVSDPRFWIIQG